MGAIDGFSVAAVDGLAVKIWSGLSVIIGNDGPGVGCDIETGADFGCEWRKQKRQTKDRVLGPCQLFHVPLLEAHWATPWQVHHSRA